MGFALVGSLGAVSQGASGAAVTPAWGAGSSRTVGNLLILWHAGAGSGGLPTTPTGWTGIALSPGNGAASALYAKIATGGDAAPTLSGVSGIVVSAMLAEFSGNVSSSAAADQTTGAGGSTSPLSAPASPDLASGELFVASAGVGYSAAATKTLTQSINNGTLTAIDNNGVSTASHYSFVWCITTTNAVGVIDTFTFTTTSIVDAEVDCATFPLRTSTDYFATASDALDSLVEVLPPNVLPATKAFQVS